MKAIHLKCENRRLLKTLEFPVFESGEWDIAEHDAEEIIGGMLYLHETKDDPSYIGGIIRGWRFVKRPQSAHSKRVVFVFESTKGGKNALWRGAGHAMAWYSGVVDE